MKSVRYPRTDPAAAWLPTALAMGVTGIVVGATIVAMNGKDFISPSVGSVLGGLVGASVAIFLWGLTYLKDQIEKQAKRDGLRAALWTEQRSILDMCYRESKWWRSLSDDRLLDAPLRIVSHFTAAVLDANLGEISSLDIKAADALLESRGRVAPLGEAVATFYKIGEEARRETLEAVQKKAPIKYLHSVEKNWKQTARNSANNIADKFMLAASSARRAIKTLDLDNELELLLIEHFGADIWAKNELSRRSVHSEIDEFEKTKGVAG